jgi:flagellar hook-associated protein 2
MAYISLLSRLRSDVSSPVSTVSTGGPAVLASVGITAASDGTLSISDAAKFDSAVGANRTGVIDLFASSDGVATRLIARLDGFVNTGGVIDGSLSTVASKVQSLNRQITALQDRLSKREASLRKQLTGLQEALGALSAQRLFFG